jgi:hypothetical protein
MGSDEIVESLPRLFPAHPLRKSTSIGTVIPATARAEVTGWMEKWVQIDPTLQEPPAMARSTFQHFITNCSKLHGFCWGNSARCCCRPV